MISCEQKVPVFILITIHYDFTIKIITINNQNFPRTSLGASFRGVEAVEAAEWTVGMRFEPGVARKETIENVGKSICTEFAGAH